MMGYVVVLSGVAWRGWGINRMESGVSRFNEPVFYLKDFSPLISSNVADVIACISFSCSHIDICFNLVGLLGWREKNKNKK